MKKADKGEKKIKGDLDKTKDGVGKLKNKNKRNLVMRFIFGGGPAGILFAVAGGLILIGLCRAAISAWKEKFMPPTESQTDTIFGISIPGMATVKALGIGIYNFVIHGIPEYYHKFVSWFSGIYKELFGKKGCIRNTDMLVLTLKKIGLAWIIGQTRQQGGGMIIKLLKFAVKLIPGFGPVAEFLMEFGPALYTFISTQLMLLWAKGKEDAINEQKNVVPQA